MPESARPQRPEPTNPGSEERATKEQIEAMADRMIDGMIGCRKRPPETAGSEPTAASPGIEVDGDRGEDIDDRLERLFADETTSAAATATAIATAPAKPEVNTEADTASPKTEPAPPVPTASGPAAGEVTTMLPEPAIPWSHTIAKPPRESRRRSDSPKYKWLAAAALGGAMISFGWLVLAPGPRPIEPTPVANATSAPDPAVPLATPPIRRPVVPAESEPVSEAEPVSESIVNSVAVEPEPIPEPVANTAAVEPEPTPEPVADTAAVEPEPTPEPVVTTATAEPEPAVEEPRNTFDLPVTAAPAEPEPAPEPAVVSASTAPRLTFEFPAANPAVKPEVTPDPEPSPPASVVEPTMPELISREAPVYRKRDGPGVILLNVLVGETGRVSRVVIKQGIPGSPLEASAIDAALRSTYRPATENGQPAKAWIVERVEFE